LKDVNTIDPYHLDEYNVKAVNYNRDIEQFPVLKAILNKITNSDIYFFGVFRKILDRFI
ncbi:MAG: DUF1846 family protein, partial [Clostridia bacterium]|nr:DUF1846 family protein [Clostridia bacterium]